MTGGGVGNAVAGFWPVGVRPERIRSSEDDGLHRIAHPRDQYGKPWIAVQVLPSRVEAKPDQPVRALVEGPVEPAKRLVDLAESGMYQCDTIGSDEALLRERLELLQHGPGLAGRACHAVREAASGHEHRPVARLRLRQGCLGERRVESALLQER